MSRAGLRNSLEDESPPTRFYGNLAQLSRNITLEDAAAASAAIYDSDVEDDGDEGIEELEDKGEDEEHDDEYVVKDKTSLFVLAGRLQKENPIKRLDEVWTRKDFTPPSVAYSNTNTGKENGSPSPMTYFPKYFPNAVFHELMEKTNLYSIHKTGKCIDATVQEIKKIVGAHILMGVVQFPRLRMYWSPATRIHFFEELRLSRNRFETLRNNLHIVDVNADHDQRDKLWKVRPIISSFENRCEQLELEENLCIDESIIPFKGQLSIKQYVKGKPNPWGVKVFMLCGASGIIYRSIVYQGSTTLPEDSYGQYSATNGLVIHLSKRIPNHCGHKLFCDNCFTSLLLLRELLDRGIFSAGIIRSNRLQKCPLKSEKELQKIGRGSSDSLVTEDGKIVAVRWYDNKVVNMASNFVGIEPQDEVKGWDRKAGEYRMSHVLPSYAITTISWEESTKMIS